jgi:hypothetical protein
MSLHPVISLSRLGQSLLKGCDTSCVNLCWMSGARAAGQRGRDEAGRVNGRSVGRVWSGQLVMASRLPWREGS